MLRVWAAIATVFARAAASMVPQARAAKAGGLAMGGLVTLGKRSVQSFGSDKCTTLAAAIAYYTIFAIFPMALFGVAVLGFFMGDASARQQMVDGITKIIPLGASGNDGLTKTLAGANHARGWLSLIGVASAAW